MLFLTILGMVACKKNIPEINYVILQGVINNTEGGQLKISSIEGFSKTINFKDSVAFIDTLRIKEGLYYIRYDKGYSPVYMAPGNVIHFSADHQLYGRALNFKGDNASINNYYSKKFLDVYAFKLKNKEHYVLEESDFENLIKKLQLSAEMKLDVVSNIPDELRAKERRALNYERINRKSIYEYYHAHFAKKEGFKTTDAFQKEINDLPLNNTADFFYSSDYKSLVSQKITKDAKEIAKRDSISSPLAQLDAASKLEKDTIANQLMYNTLNMYLPMAKQKQLLIDKYMTLSTNQEHKQKIKVLYQELQALDSNNPSPEFVNYENHDGGSTSLVDLRGKFVYMDIWATWCAPCKYEIPYLKKIEKQYHDKNIHFVSISTDKQKDKDKWKKMVTEDEMGGIQLITDNDFNTSFIKKFKIMGIPRFILLDPEGNIVRANAPRPSDKKLIDLFNELGI